MSRPDFKRVNELLSYDPLTGVLRWKVRRGSAAAGKIAGTINSNGHRQVAVDGTLYLAHHLASLLMKGVWPETMIDHRNLDRDDNRWRNLREANRSQNAANSSVRTNNKLGVKGVVQLPSGRFQAAIRIKGKQIYLGSFDTIEEAGQAYAAKAREVYGEFART